METPSLSHVLQTKRCIHTEGAQEIYISVHNPPFSANGILWDGIFDFIQGESKINGANTNFVKLLSIKKEHRTINKDPNASCWSSCTLYCLSRYGLVLRMEMASIHFF